MAQRQTMETVILVNNRKIKLNSNVKNVFIFQKYRSVYYVI